MRLGFEVNTSPVCGHLERFVLFVEGNIIDSFFLKNGDANNVIVNNGSSQRHDNSLFDPNLGGGGFS